MVRATSIQVSRLRLCRGYGRGNVLFPSSAPQKNAARTLELAIENLLSYAQLKLTTDVRVALRIDEENRPGAVRRTGRH